MAWLPLVAIATNLSFEIEAWVTFDFNGLRKSKNKYTTIRENISKYCKAVLLVGRDMVYGEVRATTIRFRLSVI